LQHTCARVRRVGRWWSVCWLVLLVAIIRRQIMRKTGRRLSPPTPQHHSTTACKHRRHSHHQPTSEPTNQANKQTRASRNTLPTTPVAGRRSPVAGRRSPVAARGTANDPEDDKARVVYDDASACTAIVCTLHFKHATLTSPTHVCACTQPQGHTATQPQHEPARSGPPDSIEIGSDAMTMQAWLGLAWLGLAWLGLAWLGLAWHAMAI